MLLVDGDTSRLKTNRLHDVVIVVVVVVDVVECCCILIILIVVVPEPCKWPFRRDGLAIFACN